MQTKYPVWYLIWIEAGVRELVYALRNSGVNTECACHHQWYIQCQTISPSEDLSNIRTVMMEAEIKDYTVSVERKVINERHYDSLTIYLTHPTKEMEKMKKKEPSLVGHDSCTTILK